jgi:hypothetical protein
MFVEGVITLIIVGALFYVAPGVLATVRQSAPIVYATQPTLTSYVNGSVDAALNASATTIGTTAAGALNLSAVSMIMMGIGIMIGGFMMLRGRAK